MNRTRKRDRAGCAERIAVDYPHEGEELTASGCAFLIDAPRAVEIAVDGGEWRPCRRGDGYWRHDWSCPAPGRHQAVVRCAGPDGAEPAIRVCRFVVAASPATVAKTRSRRDGASMDQRQDR
jgi:hypothetical protein